MKKIIKTLKIVLVSFVICLNACTTAQTSKTSPPNIIIVLADDLGYNDVSFNGSKDITTPNLDQLATNGVIFSAAYVSHPFCGPSRASIMTGRYPHLIGSQFNLPHNSEVIGEGIPLSEQFISQTLKNAGYYTGAVGKWHLGAVPKYHPNVRGFDDFYGFLGGGHNYFPSQYKAAYDKQFKAGVQVINEYLMPLEHNGKIVDETEYLTDAFSREAVRFVQDASKKEQPFFLYLAYNAPHSPMEAKKEDEALFQHIEDPKRRTYAAMVYAVDRGVGELVEALKNTKAYENTLIVFLSDNGGKLVLGGNNYPLREGKGSTYEGGYRVPMFFHWPQQLEGGKRFEYPVSSLDFYPTFTQLAKATLPDGKLLDGKNVINAIKENKNPREGEYIYAIRHREGFSDVGARKDEWKIARVANKPWQLFNIKNDSGENNDLSKQYPEKLETMVKEVKQWSSTHLQPYWFNSEEEGEFWKRDSMPRFEQTFQLTNVEAHVKR